MPLRARARIDAGAIERNCARLAALVAPAALCAVVKADGYGHGALTAARAAQAGGAAWLAVATARRGGGAARRRDRRPGPGDGRAVARGARRSPCERGADVVAWREEFVAALPRRRLGVHVKLDTGMGRLGTRDPAEATRVAARGGRARRPDAGRRDDPLRHRRRRPGVHGRAARPLHRLGRSTRRATPPTPRPRCARPRPRFDHGPLRDRDLRHGPVPARPGRPRPRAGAGARLLRRRGQARRAGGQRGLRPALRRRARRPGSPRSRSATATASAAA